MHFSFNKFELQCGLSMHLRPTYAKNFMSTLDAKIKSLANSLTHTSLDPIKIQKRLLDYIFLIWTGSIETPRRPKCTVCTLFFIFQKKKLATANLTTTF